MKKSILFLSSLFCLLAVTFSFAITEPVPHISPAHVSEPSVHVSTPTEHISTSSHATETESIPMYHPVEKLNESAIKVNINTSMYYYLVLNNHTHKYDTISAPSKEELKKKVREKTKQEAIFGGVTFVLSAVVFFFFLLVLFIPINEK